MQEGSETYSVFLLNSALPLLVLCLGYSNLRSQTDLYLSKMNEAISQLELKNLLQMIPQATFVIDDATEEILLESDAVISFFGQGVQNVLSDPIFEAKRVAKQIDDDEEM